MTESEWLASEDPAAMLAHVHGKVSDRRLRLFACACCRTVFHLLTDDAPCGTCGGRGGPLDAGGRLEGVLCAGCHGTGRVNRSRRAVEVAERFADGEASADELHAAAAAALEVWRAMDGLTLEVGAAMMAEECARDDAHDAARYMVREPVHPTKPVVAALAREVFGNPFRPSPPLPPHVLTPDVLALAQAAYLNRPGRLCLQCMGAGGVGWQSANCPECLGKGRIEDGALDHARLAVLSDALEEAGCTDDGILTHLRSPGPHCRGCWALDLALAKE